jgi:hypothetical protein
MSLASSITYIIDDNPMIREKKKRSNFTGFIISKVINALLNKNRKLKIYKQKIKDQSKMIFSSKKIPKISISEYIQRIIEYTEIENSSLIMSLIYLDRICKKDIMITELNIHRFLLMSLIISIKINEDIIYDNNYYSKVAGISIKEFNQLESEFLKLINFKLYISEEEFLKYKFYLEHFTYK